MVSSSVSSSVVLAVAVVVAVVTLRPSGLPGLGGLTDLGRRVSPGVEGAELPASGTPTGRATGPVPASRSAASVPAAGSVRPPRAPRSGVVVTFTYSVRAAGPVRTSLTEFGAAARRVYGDPRGWSLGGRVAFRQVPAGGEFTLWVATPERVAAFGSVCDRTWSCRSGRNVIVNEARWLSGSPSGLLAGDLAGYRAMVVNHETGHWLGLSHGRCPAAGGLAPLMQQQSIALQGCRPNPWPTAAERAAVAGRHPRPTG